jgi:hypothetical protein
MPDPTLTDVEKADRIEQLEAELLELRKRAGEACSRCGSLLHGWEDGWPNHGVIDLGASSQAFAALRGRPNVAEDSDFAWWRHGHPAMTVNEAQRVKFEWRDGAAYHLCFRCQRELLRIVGAFFGIPEWEAPDD